MSLLKLRETNETPPDGYRYVDPNDGWKIGPFNAKADWLNAVLQHKISNGYPISSTWREEAEDQLARILPAGWGSYGDGTLPKYFLNARINGEDVLRGTRVLAEIVARTAAFKLFGLETPFVTQERAEERAMICARCPFNIQIQGCQSCSGISNMIADVAGNIVTASDDRLASCGVCLCSNKAQTRVKIEVLRHGVTEEMMEIFPKEWCWKIQELSAL